MVEDTESFFGILHTTSQNVMLSNQIEIFILDNDGKKAHCSLVFVFAPFSSMPEFICIGGCFVEVQKLRNWDTIITHARFSQPFSYISIYYPSTISRAWYNIFANRLSTLNRIVDVYNTCILPWL